MGTADELEQVARRIIELPVELGVNAADLYRQALTVNVDLDTGGDRILSGMRQPDRLVVDVTVDETAGQVDVAAGPPEMLRAWRWLNDGTRPRIQGTGRHPGTAARYTFDAAIDTATGRVLDGIDRDFAEALA